MRIEATTWVRPDTHSLNMNLLISETRFFPINCLTLPKNNIQKMPAKKKPEEKSRLHPRNRNRERYDLKALAKAVPELQKYVKPNKYGEKSVDFADPKAVKLLNKALLSHYYGIKNWDFPDNNLCPPIPGRADYLHYIADLLSENNSGKFPTGNKIKGLDIGVGANCIYPILGVVEYGWQFIGSDIDPKSIESAQKIVEANPSLKGKIECRLQTNPKSFFAGILSKDEKIDFTLCNPPFHASAKEAQAGTMRKVQNLSGKRTISKVPLNFAGVNNELIYEGGELNFIQNMILESKDFAKNCLWFTTLVSKSENLKRINQTLKEVEAVEVKTIEMGTGNKISRIVAWSFVKC